VNGFRFSKDAEAAFGDLDALGHVNNVVYLKWLESARIAYWIQITAQKTHDAIPHLGGSTHEPGPGVVSGALIAMILARTEIDYRSPVSYGERLDVFVRTSLIKRTSIVFDYVVAARADQRVVAEAKTVVVCYDYELQRKKPVPQEIKTAILAVDKDARVEI
jgi:acyl-CoA thioester hydrolase